MNFPVNPDPGDRHITPLGVPYIYSSDRWILDIVGETGVQGPTGIQGETGVGGGGGVQGITGATGWPADTTVATEIKMVSDSSQEFIPNAWGYVRWGSDYNPSLGSTWTAYFNIPGGQGTSGVTTDGTYVQTDGTRLIVKPGGEGWYFIGFSGNLNNSSLAETMSGVCNGTTYLTVTGGDNWCRRDRMTRRYHEWNSVLYFASDSTYSMLMLRANGTVTIKAYFNMYMYRIGR